MENILSRIFKQRGKKEKKKKKLQGRVVRELDFNRKKTSNQVF